MLLQLGGSPFQFPVFCRAKELGIPVLLIDQNPAAFCRSYADAFEMVSTTDDEAVYRAAKQHSVGGILAYASDVCVPTAARVAKALGLVGHPICGAELLQRKDRFRQLQQSLGLPTPKFQLVDNVQDGQFAGTVMVKPVDASGSRGQTFLKGVEGMDCAIKKALEVSKQPHVLVEEYLEGDTLELDGDILFQDGKILFRQYGHNVLPKQGPKIPIGEIFPMDTPVQVEAELDRQFQSIIDALELVSGCLNFDGVICRGEVYILDIGLRNGGNFVPDLIQLSTNYDLTESCIRLAMGDSLRPPSELKREKVASYLLHSQKDGLYQGLKIKSQLRQYLQSSRVFVEAGDPVWAFTEGRCCFGALLFRFPQGVAVPDLDELIHEDVSPAPIAVS